MCRLLAFAAFTYFTLAVFLCIYPQMALGLGPLYGVQENQIVEINSTTGQLNPDFNLPTSSRIWVGLAHNGTSLFAADASGTIEEIMVTPDNIDVTPFQPQPQMSDVRGLVYTGNALFALSGNALLRIDRANNMAVWVCDFEQEIVALAGGGGLLFALQAPARVMVFEPASAMGDCTLNASGFDISLPNGAVPQSLAFDGRRLLAVTRPEERLLFALSPATGEVDPIVLMEGPISPDVPLSRITSPVVASVFAVDPLTQLIKEFDPIAFETPSSPEMPIEPLRSFGVADMTFSGFEGLAHSGRSLFILSDRDRRIVELDVVTERILHRFNLPVAVKQSDALAFFEGALFMLDGGGADRLIRLAINRDSQMLTPTHMCITGLRAGGGLAGGIEQLLATASSDFLAELALPDQGQACKVGEIFALPDQLAILGLTFDGRHLLAGIAGTNRSIMKLTTTGEPIAGQSFSVGFPPSGLASVRMDQP